MILPPFCIFLQLFLSCNLPVQGGQHDAALLADRPCCSDQFCPLVVCSAIEWPACLMLAVPSETHMAAGDRWGRQSDDAMQQDCSCRASKFPSQPQRCCQPGRRHNDSPRRGCGTHLPGGSVFWLQRFHTVSRKQRASPHETVQPALRCKRILREASQDL